MKKIPEKKIKEVKNLEKLLSEDVNIGIVDLTNLPSAQFQSLRNKLKNELNIRTSKKKLIILALEEIKKSKKDIEKLEKYLENAIPALIFTKEDSFKLAKTIKKNKSNLPAKPGQVSPKDIVIPSGPTKFPPGPIIGELGAAGIKAAIESGKVVIKQDVHLVREGDVITQKQADLLAKFGIQPMEIGLNLLAIYQKGDLFDKEVLFIDEAEYFKKFKTAASEALNLAVYAVYPANETIKILLQKAEREKLAIESKIDIKKIPEEPKEEKAEEPQQEQQEPETIEETQQEQPKEEEQQENQVQEPKKEEPQQLKNPTGYNEEDAKKAQDIINQMKDKG